jgi:hypothetical protein
MKESIGGVWLFGIVITFIVFFTCFVSFSTNYSRAFKVKDEVLASIEHYRGVNELSLARISEYMSEIGYYGKGNCKNTSDAELVATASDPTFTYSKWIGFVGNVNA